MYQKQIVEIDLKEWIWKLLSQWKAIIIVSLIMALLICGLKHHNDVKAYNAYMASKAEAETLSKLTKDEQIETLLMSLPEEDREKVLFVVSEKEWLNDQKKYIEESVLMDTNPSNQRVLKTVLLISSEDEALLPVLVNNYLVYSQGSEVCEAVKPYIADGCDNKYISELFYTEENDYQNEFNGNNVTLCLNLVLPEDADAALVSKALEDVVSDYCKSLQSKYLHSIKIAESEVVHMYHKNNFYKINSILSNINSLKASIKTSEGELTAQQSEVLNSIMALNELPYEQGVGIDETDAGVDNGPKPSYSIKHAILGFVLGAFFYAVAYLMIIVLKGYIYSAASLERFSQSRILGELYCLSDKGGLSTLLRSNAVNKLHYRDKLDINKQIDKTVKSIDAAYKHSQRNVLALLSLVKLDEETQKRHLIDQIREKNLQRDSIVLYDVTSDIEEKEFLSFDGAAIIVEDTTNYSSIRNLINLCKEYEIPIMGSIFISEI